MLLLPRMVAVLEGCRRVLTCNGHGLRLTSGLTAKDWARFCGHEDLVEILTPSEKTEHEIMAELDRLQVRVG